MSCNCKNPDGTPSNLCFGICFPDGALRRQEDPPNSLAEYVLAQLEKRIDYRLAELKVAFERDQINLYKKAFLEGLNEGIAIGRNIDGF